LKTQRKVLRKEVFFFELYAQRSLTIWQADSSKKQGNNIYL
jgi:hypothetical protein